ncbi:MAG: amidohydrolase family protein, partial [Selenomonadaceae bacterium]|nr:amidohydrolase family protein [Selenomonadaceae bacterium]
MLYGTHIEGILPMEDFRPDMADEIYDAQGKYVSPGFIDVHIHGCVGHDTMDETDEALPAMRAFQAKSGVTGFLPTTMTYDMPRIHRALERIREEMGKPGGARVLGAHME